MTLLRDRSTVVFGGASGIGQATATLFAQEGANVAVFDLNGSAADRTASEIRGAGGRALSGEVDVRDRQAVAAAVATAHEALGALDVVVITPFAPPAMSFLEMTPGQWRNEMEVMFGGAVYAFQAAIPLMKAQGRGVLLATSSAHFPDYGVMGHPVPQPAYASAKGAIEVLIRTIARLHSPDGIRVNAVQPSFTLTQGMLDLFLPTLNTDLETYLRAREARTGLRAADPSEIAQAFLFLASDYATYINGVSLPADGGSLTNAYGKLSA